MRTLYDQLIGSSFDHSYSAVPLNQDRTAYLAIDSQRRPALFIVSTPPSLEAPLRTAQVSLRLASSYTLTPPSGPPIEGTFSCLACEATDRIGIETFLVLAEAFVASAKVDDASLVEFFRSIVRLFSLPSARDLAAEREGLWGELFLMQCVKGFAFWAPFWHTEPTRRFDFSANGRRVEVKTALEGPRIHHFRHLQIYAIAGEEIVVASLLVNHDDAGLSLRELILSGREAMASTPYFMSLERAVRRAGMDDPTEQGPAFDPRAAKTHLAWYDAREVPHFRLAEPPGVSDTRYRIDLSTAPRLDSDRVESWLDEWTIH